MKKIALKILPILLLISIYTQAQNATTAEDSLQSNSSFLIKGTTLGGYGNAVYRRDFNEETSTMNLDRFVLFVGHKFTKQISFFSEIEIEDAKVSGGEEGGEVALEQCFLKFNLNKNHYLVAGLFIPRIGILNENHLPNSFNGNDRTLVETYIIPSTWRELGVGLYGNLNSFPLSYSVGLMNGLNSSAFEHGTVIRDGRFEGREASANNLAATASVQYNKNNFKFQVSGYYGGTVGLSPDEASSLKLESGPFSIPVMLGEANLQFESKGFSGKLLGTLISISDAKEINRVYGNNTPEVAYGFYGEIAYNLFEKSEKLKSEEFNIFVRYEKLDMNATIPSNGLIDGTLDQQHIITGISYLPSKNVAIKADIRMKHTGKQNPNLVINPNETYKVDNTFLNLGVGFSF
jgi:hypothetical protein